VSEESRSPDSACSLGYDSGDSGPDVLDGENGLRPPISFSVRNHQRSHRGHRHQDKTQNILSEKNIVMIEIHFMTLFTFHKGTQSKG